MFEYYARYMSEYNCRIFLWTLSTGDPHPLTMGNHVITHVSRHRLRIPDGSPITICGDTLSILFDNPRFDNTEIMLWNWKTGDVLAVGYLRI
jgi:hypothetical protein